MGLLNSLLGHTRSRRGLSGFGRRRSRSSGLGRFFGNPIARVALGSLAAFGARKWYGRRGASSHGGQRSPSALGAH